MAANDELPRGLVVSGSAVGNLLLTLPASAGISWVLTEYNLLIVSNTGSGGAHGANISFNNNTPPGGLSQILGACYLESTSGNDASNTFSWTGQALGVVGQQLQIDFNSNDTGITVYANMSAYPV